MTEGIVIVALTFHGAYQEVKIYSLRKELKRERGNFLENVKSQDIIIAELKCTIENADLQPIDFGKEFKLSIVHYGLMILNDEKPNNNNFSMTISFSSGGLDISKKISGGFYQCLNQVSDYVKNL